MLKYRADIDGLRAVAIISVLLFHTGIGFSGGYVGVDVFFVISGFLITGLIVKDLDSGQFRIVEFWERRIRRILPPLAVVIIASIVAGWFLFIPIHFKELGNSVIAQALLGSNIHFWRQSGYFADGVELKPLFHTWSLAVEEQFYLLLPFLLIGLHRISRKLLIPSILILGSLSFALSVYCSYRHDIANFYLLPMRAWELFLGALLAVLPSNRKPTRWLQEFLSCLGFAAILFAVFAYGRATRFPGASALLPCLGTALIIWSNGQTLTLAGKLLAARPVVFVGLISYSLYLWHWPVLVFYRYAMLNPIALPQRLILVAVSFALAILSWRFVETPFRKRIVLNSRSRISLFAGATTAVLLLAGLGLNVANGIPSRLPPQAQQYANAITDKAFQIDLTLQKVQHGDFIELGSGDKDRPIDLLVWGDSHAMAAMAALDALCRERAVRGVAATHSSQVPFVGYVSRSQYALMEESVSFNDAVVSAIRDRHIKDVLLIASWNGYFNFEHGAANLHRGLLETIQTFKDSDCRIWIMKSVPIQPWNVPNALAITVMRGGDPKTIGVSIGEHLEVYRRLAPIFDGIDMQNVSILDPTELFVTPAGFCPVERDGKAIYLDSHHLTTHGAMILKPLFEPIFKRIEQRRPTSLPR